MPNGPSDGECSRATHIDLAEDAALGYWTHELRCSADALLAALESVGRDASEVAEFLESAR